MREIALNQLYRMLTVRYRKVYSKKGHALRRVKLGQNHNFEFRWLLAGLLPNLAMGGQLSLLTETQKRPFEEH